ncbi:hypothetical protein [Enhydrobacter sp.]|jgi:hypothetical protein|uniref:hypothetical protein n=1 Tax=Enhydrobacter sp. TaxID=1894999 RepID=UPI00261410CA|nr:hypothetical protein [Enhydrobacter sp.]
MVRALVQILRDMLMRYLHGSSDQIRRYVEALNLVITKCTQGTVSVTSDVNEIAKTLERTQTLWGAKLPYYFFVSKSADQPRLALPQAVSRVESSATEDEFLIVPYEDGGIISVSGTELPFQKEARVAEWWKP